MSWCARRCAHRQAAPLILGALIVIPEPYTGQNSLMPFWVLVLLGEVKPPMCCMRASNLAVLCILRLCLTNGLMLCGIALVCHADKTRSRFVYTGLLFPHS
jgi:hypothetical protein